MSVLSWLMLLSCMAVVSLVFSALGDVELIYRIGLCTWVVVLGGVSAELLLHKKEDEEDE